MKCNHSADKPLASVGSLDQTAEDYRVALDPGNVSSPELIPELAQTKGTCPLLDQSDVLLVLTPACNKVCCVCFPA